MAFMESTLGLCLLSVGIAPIIGEPIDLSQCDARRPIVAIAAPLLLVYGAERTKTALRDVLIIDYSRSLQSKQSISAEDCVQRMVIEFSAADAETPPITILS
jgi:hypothetical protein